MKRLLVVLLVIALIIGIVVGIFMMNKKEKSDTLPEDVLFKQGTIIDIRPGKDVTYVTIGKNIEEIESAFVFIVGPNTIIVDKQGNNLTVEDLNVGDNIGVYHSMVTTASIPPQSKAYKIVKN